MDEQNEHEWIKWGAVRKIKSWDLLTVERTLRAVLRREEAPYWLYQAARDHVGSSMNLNEGIDPENRGDRPILATVFQGQGVRRMLNSGDAMLDLDNGRGTCSPSAIGSPKLQSA